MLSTGTLAPAPPGAVVEHMSGAPAEIVSQLAARGVRVPVLIGTGIPLFGAMERDLVLEHVGTRQYDSGLVQSEYLVAT